MIRFPWVLLVSAAALVAGLFGVTWYASLDEAGRQEADGLAEEWAKRLARKRQELLGQAGEDPPSLPSSEDFSS
jgi:hypothetical protein